MLESATGIVLRTYRLTDTSLIVHWLAEAAGRVSTVAKGALRPKSPFRGKLDLFYVSDFTFQRSRRSDLHTLRELTLLETHPVFRNELWALQQACYCAALLEQTTEADTPLPGLFELFNDMLGSYRGSAKEPVRASAARVLAFELRLLRELGLEPDWAATKLSDPSRKAVENLLDLSFDEAGKLSLPRTVENEISAFLHGFLIYEFGRLARGREQAVHAML